MLISLRKPLKAGDTMDLSLKFGSGKLIELSIPVVSIKRIASLTGELVSETQFLYVFQNILRVVCVPSSNPFLFHNCKLDCARRLSHGMRGR